MFFSRQRAFVQCVIHWLTQECSGGWRQSIAIGQYKQFTWVTRKYPGVSLSRIKLRPWYNKKLRDGGTSRNALLIVRTYLAYVHIVLSVPIIGWGEIEKNPGVSHNYYTVTGMFLHKMMPKILNQNFQKYLLLKKNK